MLATAMAVAFVLAGGGTAGAWYGQGGAYNNGTTGMVGVYGAAGENSNLTVTALPGLAGVSANSPGLVGTVRLHDPDNPVTQNLPTSGCDQIDEHTLECHAQHFGGPAGAASYLEFRLEDGDDRLHMPRQALTLTKYGTMGAGDDVLIGEDRSGGTFDMGDGNDEVILRSGGGEAPWYPYYKYVSGGAGDDVLRLVNRSDDEPTCGEGADVLYADAGESSDDCETIHTYGLALP